MSPVNLGQNPLKNMEITFLAKFNIHLLFLKNVNFQIFGILKKTLKDELLQNLKNDFPKN